VQPSRWRQQPQRRTWAGGGASEAGRRGSCPRAACRPPMARPRSRCSDYDHGSQRCLGGPGSRRALPAGRCRVPGSTIDGPTDHLSPDLPDRPREGPVPDLADPHALGRHDQNPRARARRLHRSGRYCACGSAPRRCRRGRDSGRAVRRPVRDQLHICVLQRHRRLTVLDFRPARNRPSPCSRRLATRLGRGAIVSLRRASLQSSDVLRTWGCVVACAGTPRYRSALVAEQRRRPQGWSWWHPESGTCDRRDAADCREARRPAKQRRGVWHTWLDDRAPRYAGSR
jgi:hypothetical protein